MEHEGQIEYFCVLPLFLLCQCYRRGRLFPKLLGRPMFPKVIVALEDRTPDLVSNSKDQQVGKFEVVTED